MEEMKYKVSIDGFDQTNNFSGDLYMMQLAQQQAQMMASQSAIAISNYGGLDPRRAFAEESYSSSIQRMSQNSMVGLYGLPTMSPYNFSQPFQYPRGYIPGKPDFPEYSGSFFNSASNYAMTTASNAFFNKIGMGGYMGVGSRIDDPIFRQVQSMTEIPARQLADLTINTASNSAKAVALATQAFSYMKLATAPSMILNPLMLAGAKAVDYAAEGIKDYLDMGEYFRDSMAPHMHGDRLGGGPNFNQIADLQKKMGKIIAQDKTFTRQDYAGIEKLAAEEGFLQTNNTIEKATKAIENIGKNLKSLYALGGKVADTVQYVEQLNQLGVNMASGTGAPNQFLSQLSVSAFQSGRTMQEIMPRIAQAGQLAQIQGLAPMVGGLTQMKSEAMAGVGIRSGAFSQEDLAYYGNQQGIAESTTRLMSNITRSPIGNIMSLAMINNPDMIGNLQNIGLGGITSKIPGMANPSTYFNLQLRMPELSRMIAEKDPDAFGISQLSAYSNMVSDTMGGKKLTAGELYAILTNPNMIGASPQDARAMIKQIENAPAMAQSARDSMMNKLRQTEMETLRYPGLLTTSGWQNMVEKYTEQPIANAASWIQRKMGHLAEVGEDLFIKAATGKDVIRSETLSTQDKVEQILGLQDNTKITKELRDRKKEAANRLVESDFEGGLYKSTKSKMQQEFSDFSNIADMVLGKRLQSDKAISKSSVTDEDFQNVLNSIQNNGLNQNNRDMALSYIASRGKSEDAVNAFNKLNETLNATSVDNMQVVQRVKQSETTRGSIVAGFRSTDEASGDVSKFINMNIKNDTAGLDFMRNVLSGNTIDMQSKLEYEYASFLGKKPQDLTMQERKDAGIAFRDIANLTNEINKGKSTTYEAQDLFNKAQEKANELDKASGPLSQDVRKKAMEVLSSQGSKDYAKMISNISGEDISTMSTSKIEAVDKIMKSQGMLSVSEKLKKGGKLSESDLSLLRSMTGSKEIDQFTRGVLSVYQTTGRGSDKLADLLKNKSVEYHDQAKGLAPDDASKILEKVNKINKKSKGGFSRVFGMFTDRVSISGEHRNDESIAGLLFQESDDYLDSRNLKEAAEKDMASEILDLRLNASNAFGVTGSQLDELESMISNKERSDSENATMFAKMMSSSHQGVKELASIGRELYKNKNQLGNKDYQKAVRNRISSVLSTNNIIDNENYKGNTILTDQILNNIGSGESDDIILSTMDKVLKTGGVFTTGAGKASDTYDIGGKYDEIIKGFGLQQATFEKLYQIFEKLDNSDNQMFQKIGESIAKGINTTNQSISSLPKSSGLEQALTSDGRVRVTWGN